MLHYKWEVFELEKLSSFPNMNPGSSDSKF